MSKKMTVVFHEEDLYMRLKIEAVKRRTTASAIISEAVSQWLECAEDAELVPAVQSARTEWKTKGGRSWSEVEGEIEEAVNRRDKPTEAGIVPN